MPSPKINWDSPNLPGEWKRFRQHVDLMFSGPLSSKKEEERCSYLLLWIGEKGRDIFNTWTLTVDEAKLLKSYYDRFEAYVMPKKNTIFARYKFHEKMQGSNETLEQFVTELLEQDCAYANQDEMVRDRIVFGIHSTKVREKLLNVGSELTLDKAVDIARAHKLSHTQMRTISGGTSNGLREQSVHAIQRRASQSAATGARPKHYKAQRGFRMSDTDNKYTKQCGYCGNKAHGDKESCPAKGKQCFKCGKLNHFARVCKTAKGKTVHTVDDEQTPHRETV